MNAVGGKDDHFDLVVVGAGPGGYVAAIRAAQLGLRTAIVERDKVGGVCLNWGCIPTKSLLRSSELYHLIGRSEDFGISVTGVTFDLGKIIARSRQVAGQLSSGIGHLLKKNGISLIAGTATLGAGRSLSVETGSGTRVIKAGNIIIATGARPRMMPGVLPGGDIWTSFEALQATEVPKSLVVIGTGAIGAEFASFFSTLGAKVTLVEMADRILPGEDAEISAAAYKAFTRQGMAIRAGTKVTSLKPASEGGVVVELAGKDGKTETLQAEKALVAIGIVANVEGLGLEAAGVKLAYGDIVIDDHGETSVPGIFAIGDCAGPPQLAHKASHQGIACVEYIAGNSTAHGIDVTNIPGCTYCWPQIASIGLTEEKARDKGYDLKVGRFPLTGNGKALAIGEPEGFVKVVIHARTGELLGAHIIGPEATELIQGLVIAKTVEATHADIQAVIFPHPTLSEAVHEAMLQVDDRAVHI